MKSLNFIFRMILVTGIFLLFSHFTFSQETENKTEKSNVEFFKGGVKIEKHGNDTTVVFINNKDFHHWPDKDFPFCCKKGKYNGHWAGIELGWNGYATPDFNMSFPPSEQYMNLNTSRSLMVNINPFEFNLNLVKNRFGLTSGLGFSLNNYYFSNSIILIPDSSELVAYWLVDQNGNPADMKVNKLYVGWMTVPILFEYQTNSRMRMNSFHAAIGIVGGIRLESYTKQSFYARNVTYYLQDDNGKKVATLNVGDDFIRKHNQYHLSPFKLDATVRIGWSFLNLYATYSLTPMFQNNQGPELYPWTVGITLLGW